MELYDVETYEHEGVSVRIVQDPHGQDPFEAFDQAAHLVWFDRADWPRHAAGTETIDADRFVSVAHAQRYLTMFGDKLIALPFRLDDYGSSGTSAYLVDADSDRAAGFVCVSQAGVDLTGCPDPEQAARQDFATWAAWISGEVYAFIVAEGTPDEESCWGFYGDTEDDPTGIAYVKEEANAVAHEIAEERARLRALPWLPTFGNPIQTAAS